MLSFVPFTVLKFVLLMPLMDYGQLCFWCYVINLIIILIKPKSDMTLMCPPLMSDFVDAIVSKEMRKMMPLMSPRWKQDIELDLLLQRHTPWKSLTYTLQMILALSCWHRGFAAWLKTWKIAAWQVTCQGVAIKINVLLINLHFFWGRLDSSTGLYGWKC